MTGARPLFITGAAGFIGRALADRWRAAGEQVVGADLRTGPGVDVAFDVRDVGAVRAAILEARPRALVHCAAVVDDRIDAPTTEAINVGGSANILAACEAAGVKRLVHLSSIAALGVSPPPGQRDDSPPDVVETEPYFGTKARSEALMREAMERSPVEIVVVRPGDVWGPGSEPWVNRIVAMMRQGLPVRIGGGRGIMTPCHVENLLDGIELALHREDATGGVFTIHDGEPMSYTRYLVALAEAARLPRPRASLPRSVALIAATLGMEARRRFGIDSPLSTSGVRYVTRQTTYDLDHSRLALGYAPRVDFAEGMRALRLALEGSQPSSSR